MTSQTGVQVPEKAVELARIAFEENRAKPTELAIRDALQAALPAIYEDFKERQARAIDAIPSYSDEQIAARRGPMKHWLDADDIFAALVAAFPQDDPTEEGEHG